MTKRVGVTVIGKRKRARMEAELQERLNLMRFERERFLAGLSANDLASLCAASHGRGTPNEADKLWAKRRRQEARRVVGTWLVQS